MFFFTFLCSEASTTYYTALTYFILYLNSVVTLQSLISQNLCLFDWRKAVLYFNLPHICPCSMLPSCCHPLNLPSQREEGDAKEPNHSQFWEQSHENHAGTYSRRRDYLYYHVMPNAQTSWNDSKRNRENVTTSSVWITTEQFVREWRSERHIYRERSNYVSGRIFTWGTLMIDRCELHIKVIDTVGYLVVQKTAEDFKTYLGKFYNQIGK